MGNSRVALLSAYKREIRLLREYVDYLEEHKGMYRSHEDAIEGKQRPIAIKFALKEREKLEEELLETIFEDQRRGEQNEA